MFNKLKELIGLDSSTYYEDDVQETSPVSSQTGGVSVGTSPYSSLGETLNSGQAYSHPEVDPTSTYQAPTPSSTAANSINNPANNVVGMPGNRWWGAVAEVVVMEPRNFDEMPQVIQSLKDRKSVVLNLTMMDAEQAQRAVDFVAGATFTIDGHQERIGESIFLFTPSCVQVSTQAGLVREVPHPQSQPLSSPAPAWNTAVAM
ncbi:cell division protein SepF [Synechococcus sp. PCC 6312]|uniref:cell division protein SepF n=1 Tax=Synechococcus sp. (strain ATCC 27167 / PCC 6312) TaxID=195253 RepID=UPI00029ED06B|nr:hypothetical protein Syn6312_2489 [Synechococcus sp. PCC 6312]